MSQPTRYTTKLLQSDKTGRLEVCPCYEGEWVAYSDYAALAAENERLSKMFADLETPYLSKNLIDSAYAEKLKALAAENERLRKAGDAMKHWIVSEGYDLLCVDAWNAAKEGGSK